MTILDSRSRPTTEVERAQLYKKPDPTEGLLFAMCTEPGECAVCGGAILTLESFWIKKMGADSSEVQLAKLDSNYAGEDVYAYMCWSCTKTELGPAVSDYAQERQQSDREARLEVACEAERLGDLTPDHWYTIMEANLGYCEPQSIPMAISAMCAEYRERYGAREEYLEEVRRQLYKFVPQRQITLQPEGEVQIEQGENGLARFSFLARVAVR